jgi:hypothetical protein
MASLIDLRQRRRREVVAEGHAGLVITVSFGVISHRISRSSVVDWLDHFVSSHFPIVRRKASARWDAVALINPKSIHAARLAGKWLVTNFPTCRE